MTSQQARTLLARTPTWAWVVGALLLAVVILIALWDWNWFKGPVERRVAAATGRSFAINGDLDVDLGWQSKLKVGDVHLGNAQWSQQREMAAVDRLELRIALLPLFRGRIELPYVDADRPRLLLERNQDGKGNWIFKQQPPQPRSTRVPVIGQLLVNDGVLRVHEPTFKTDVRLDIHSGKAADNARAPLLASGEGTYRGRPFQLEGRVDSPLDLRDKDRPFRVDIRARAGETRAHVSGALPQRLQLDDFNVRVDLSGENLADYYELIGVPLPDTPPYDLRGQLYRQGGAVWSYRKFTGKVGDSDMSGDASLDIGRERPLLTGEVVSQRLDFDDLASLIGAAPSAKPGETISAEQLALAQQRKAKPKVLPDTPFRLDKLRVMDADVKLHAAHIEAPKLPLDQMSVHAVLQDGVLKLNPLDFAAAGGRIAARVSLDARQPSIQTTATADVRGLELPKLFPSVEITKKGAGRLSGVMALTAQGNSIAHMFGSSNGNVGLVMGPGRISNLLVELAGLDVAESLKYLFDKDREIPLRCAYADFKVVDGEMHANGLAFDTADTVIYGQGEIDLRNERIELRLLPQPKDKSPVSLRVPLQVGGTFKDPSFRPEAGPLILRTAAATALYSVAPPAALLALIETGPGENIDCGAAQATSS